MKRLAVVKTMAIFAVMASVGPGAVQAQHIDVLTQQVAGRLATGAGDFDTDTWTIGERVFHRDFGSSFSISNPGFNSIGAGSPDMPAGAQALPASAALSWDFVPMTINAVSRNLFYWNGQDTDGVAGLSPNDVSFGAPPSSNYALSLFDNTNAKFSTNGTDALVVGGRIATTAADGFVHSHLPWFLEDNDSNSLTKPADGIYLVSLRLHMPGAATSLPVFMIFGTPNSSIAAEDDAAVPWVEQKLAILTGDYNDDGVVNAADYVVWRKALVQPSADLRADGNLNNQIDSGDYSVWRAHFGETDINLGSAAIVAAGPPSQFSVPEPSVFQLVAALSLVAVNWRGASNRKETVP